MNGDLQKKKSRLLPTSLPAIFQPCLCYFWWFSTEYGDFSKNIQLLPLR